MSSTSVTGVGTTFNGSNVNVGDQIIWGDAYAVVTVVGGATSLTIDHAVTEANTNSYEVEKATDCGVVTPTTTLTRYTCTFTTSPAMSYNTGTASTSGSSSTVTGSGTAWNTANVAVGDEIVFKDGVKATIITVGGATSLTVDHNINEGAGSVYEIDKPQPSVNGGVYARYTSATGAFNFYFDGAQLELGSNVSNYADPGFVLNNLVTNPSLENGNTNGWAVHNTSTGLAVSGLYSQTGNNSLTAVTGATNINNGVQYNYAFSPNTQYSLSFWIRRDAGSSTNNQVGFDENGTDNSCLNNFTVNTTWTQYTCTYTVGATVNTASNFYIKNNSAATNTYYIDGVTLVQGPSPLPYTAPAANLDINSFLDTVTLNGANTGDVQPWRQTTPTNTGDNPAQACVVNGYAYMYSGSAISTYEYGKINADGSIKSWTNFTGPNTDSLKPCVSYNGYLYYFGGFSITNTVSYAKTNPSDGSVGPWNTANAMPASLKVANAVAVNGYVYVMGGSNGIGQSQGGVYYAKLNADGSLGAWITSGVTIPDAEQRASAVAANGFIYLVGGYNGFTGTLKTVLCAAVAADGSIGTFNICGNMPDVRQDNQAYIANGYIYSVGGGNTKPPPAELTRYFTPN